MIVSELIKKLGEFPPAMRVLGRGYESGWEDIRDIEINTVYHFPENPRYEGKYQDIVFGGKKYTDQSDCVCIS